MGRRAASTSVSPPTSASVGPPRQLTVWCPQWPVVAAGAEAGVPAAVLHANRVVAASPAAQAEGVVPGMRRREAQRACPTVALLPHDPVRDARAFELVPSALEQVVARLEVARPGLVRFTTRGPARYHGGDEPLARTVAEVVIRALGTRAEVGGLVGVGVGDGRFASAIAARRASEQAMPVVVPTGRSGAFLAPMPVGLLADGALLPELHGPGLTERLALVDLFGRLGLLSLGSVAALAAADVAGRFGVVGRAAHRQAGGHDELPPAADVPPVEWSVGTEIEPPVHEAGPVAFVAKALADDLLARLAAHGLACVQVVVVVETEHGERRERSWRRVPAFSAAAIVERVRWQLEGWGVGVDAPSGGVAMVRLVPAEVVAATGHQLGFWGGSTQADERAWRAVARLVGQVGTDGVLVPVWRGGRGPGAPWALVEAATADPDGRAAAVRPPAAGPGPWPGRLPDPLPAVVHRGDDRSPAEVVDDAGQRVQVSGRGALSAAPVLVTLAGAPPRRVTAWAGPWPVEERWWDPAHGRRQARVQVVTEGGAAWLFACEQGRWWVDACYA